jgi:hypothetical protein
MAEIADLSALVNRLTGGNSGTPEHLFFHKQERVNGALAAATVAGRWTSLWRYEGQPAHGAVQGATGAAFDNTTNGGLKQADPGGGRQKWLVGANLHSNVAGTIVLYDRLAADGTFSGTTTTAQTVSFTPPSRYSSGVGNQVWIEIQTAIGSTATTATVNYTDQDGNTGVISPTFSIGGAGLQEAERIIPVSLATGDTGVRNVADVDLVASTGTAGDFAVILAHPLVTIPVYGGGGTSRDLIFGDPGVIEIPTDACLAMAWIANGTTRPQIFGSLHMLEA